MYREARRCFITFTYLFFPQLRFVNLKWTRKKLFDKLIALARMEICIASARQRESDVISFTLRQL
jgi:hypothetical protein